MKFLVIQQKMIGDVLISSILCDNLRKAFPDSIIDYLVYETTTDVLKGNKSITNIIPFKEKHRKNKWDYFKFLLRIRKEKYDVVIDAYAKIESFLPVLFSGAKQKISFSKKWQNIFYTDLVAKIQVPKTNLGLVIEQRLALISPLNLSIELETFPKLYVSKEEMQFADTLFSTHSINSAKKTIMVSIVGSDQSKTYPHKYMAQIIDTIATDNDVNLLFNYFPKQIEIAKSIFDLCKNETKSKVYFDVLGKNIREFIAIMNKCDMIIGNDGGAINMAKALDKPSFIVFSPWIDKKGWATFEDGVKHVSVHLNEYKPELLTKKELKKEIQNNVFLYNSFEPNLFKNKLLLFLKTNLF